MPRRTGPVTVDEFARLPDDDFRYELVSGVVHRMSPGWWTAWMSLSPGSRPR